MKKILGVVAAGALAIGLWAAPAAADGHAAACESELEGTYREAGRNNIPKCDVEVTVVGDIDWGTLDLDETTRTQVGRSGNTKVDGTAEAEVEIWKVTYELDGGGNWVEEERELEGSSTETVDVTCITNPAGTSCEAV